MSQVSTAISHFRQPFDRKYDQRLTMEHFIVNKRGTKEGIPYYTLKDMLGEELNKVIMGENTIYRVESLTETTSRPTTQMDGMARQI